MTFIQTKHLRSDVRWGTVAMVMLLSLLVSGCGFFSDADEKFYFGEPRGPEKLERQYPALANVLHSIKPCYLINDQSLTTGGFNAVGSQVTLTRSHCFMVVATATGDPKFCQKVRSASTLFLSGSNFGKSTCHRLAHSKSGFPTSRLNVPEIVSLAGYKMEEIDAYLVEKDRFSSLEAAMQFRQHRASTYWDEVSMTLLHTAEFFDRIEQLPGFGSEEDHAKMRAVPWEPRQQRLWVPPEQRTRSLPEVSVP